MRKQPRIIASITASLLLLGLASVQAADPVVTDPSKTTLGVFTGADAGEGLDLTGNFIYALSFGADPAESWQIHDALFKGVLADEVPGALLTAQNRIQNWYPANYGDTADDDNLEFATSSIRWSAAPEVVTLNLDNILVGAQYKLQFMFGEQCCNRGFNVLVDGNLIVKDFNPGNQHGGINIGTQEALITHTLIATKSSITIVLDGPSSSPDYNDHNAIFNALTVEQLAAAGDTDGDGLSDAWEQLYFQNLTQTPGADPDSDGLTNGEEFTAGTDPTKGDGDGDGLTDSQEVKTYNTDPKRADTDSDGLSDQAEIVTHKTDPLKRDSDGDKLSDGREIDVAHTDPVKPDTDADGMSDFDELVVMTDPTSASSVSKTTSVGVITGGDPGEGLDLQGKFIYAFSIGTENPAGQVGDANFAGETGAGVTVEQATSIIEGWYQGRFGETPNDVALAAAISSIRHGGGGARVLLENLTQGATYKLQLMFGEWCCARAMDIQINGRQIADEFAPYIYQGGNNANSPATNHAAVVTYTFVANTNAIEIRTVGGTVTTPEYTDRNPILNAVSLEESLPPTDTDSDGLPDEWERLSFGNLTQTGTGDGDADALPNTQEFALGTDGTKPDTDGDGLKDGEEVATTKTDPSMRDTDSDGLSDGDEINTYKTNATVPDSDDDGLPDGLEVITTGPVSKVSNILIQAFSGGDPGEGLDLEGTFRYAVNVSSAGAAGKAGDADFTADNVPGVTITAPSNIPAWDMPEYGETPADNVIEKVTQSIRYGPTMRVLLSGLSPGAIYRLQMLFFEQCCAGRGFNIYVDGESVAPNFSPPAIQGGVNNTAAGALVSVDIETGRDNMSIVLTVLGRTDETLTDPNAILDGFTLEVIRQGTTPTRPTLTFTRAAAGTLTLTTDATLQVADVVTGPYTNLPDRQVTVDPRTAGARKFYRATR